MGSFPHNDEKATSSQTINGVRRGSVVTDTTKSVVDRESEEEKPGESQPLRIRCPLCRWPPRKVDKWFCECGHEWNTFDTGGVCPACLHQWTETQCLSCSRWSAHSEWYAHS